MTKPKSKYKTANIFLSAILGLCLLGIILIIYFISPVSTKGKDVEFIVSKGDSLRDIAKNLETKGLIKNDKFFLAYVVIKDSKQIYAAKYRLNSSMFNSGLDIVVVVRNTARDKSYKEIESALMHLGKIQKILNNI